MRRSGFTLIELVISFGIFSALATGTTLMLTATLRGAARGAAESKVRNEGEYLMETISQRVRYSTSVVCNDPSTLTVNSSNSADNTVFYCNSARGSISRNGTGINNDMNSDEVIVSGCQFVCSPAAVEVSFSVTDVNSLVDPLVFNTNIVLRNKR